MQSLHGHKVQPAMPWCCSVPRLVLTRLHRRFCSASLRVVIYIYIYIYICIYIYSRRAIHSSKGQASEVISLVRGCPCAVNLYTAASTHGYIADACAAFAAWACTHFAACVSLRACVCALYGWGGVHVYQLPPCQLPATDNQPTLDWTPRMSHRATCAPPFVHVTHICWPAFPGDGVGCSSQACASIHRCYTVACGLSTFRTMN